MIKPLLIAVLLLLSPLTPASGVVADQDRPTADSPTEGVITHDFVAEPQMLDDLMAMLARFSEYATGLYEPLPDLGSAKQAWGIFRSNSTRKANEDGVRTNADLSMVCAFLYKYGKDKVSLPKGIEWNDIHTMALGSLRFAVGSHKAVRLAACKDNKYWGSTSATDNQWESSLWAMSVAYAACFLWDDLTKKERQNVYKLLKAECQYELERSIPTGYKGDTKAEENGWEACVLAATLGLFPHDKLAPQWFDRLRRFAINSYSHESDANDSTVVDPHYDNLRVMDLYEGANLYPDYTLQNHNYFHTSYQNVVIQELGEAALALKLFQSTLHGKEKWHTRALFHNCAAVERQVLNELALADGELAMPNGNDWSLFLYDQITSYSTLACFLQDPDALLLENLAYKQIQARQTTTPDGSWLLRSDIGPRRMGVEAHRVMMTWLMHHQMPTADLRPTSWKQFRSDHAEAKVLRSQGIVRAFTADRFTTFGWQPGIRSFTGYIASNTPDKNKIIVPYKANNSGNFLGWFSVKDHKTNAVAADEPRFHTDGTAWTLDGHLFCNDSTLDHRFAIYSTPGNALVYTDRVVARRPLTVTREQGGLLAISTDELTKTRRTLYYHPEPEGDADPDYDYDMPSSQILSTTTSGDSLSLFNSMWINIDNEIGVLTPGHHRQAFGGRRNNNSIMTSKLYAQYRDLPEGEHYETDDVVAERTVVYYTGVSSEQTLQLSRSLRVGQSTTETATAGNCIVTDDPDGRQYFLLTHFNTDTDSVRIDRFRERLGAPVLAVETTVRNSQSYATIALRPNESYAQQFVFYIDGTDVVARSTAKKLWVRALADTKISIRTIEGMDETVELAKDEELTLDAAEPKP